MAEKDLAATVERRSAESARRMGCAAMDRQTSDEVDWRP